MNLLELSHRAMACEFVVLVRDEHQRIGRRSVVDIALDALESIDAVERRLTVYDARSEISAINQSAGQGPVTVSRETFDVLRHAVELNAAMEGAFDITAGPLIDAWGFTTRQGRKPTFDEIDEALKLVGCSKLKLDATNTTVELLTASMRINLGGIGKGDAIDRVADRLLSAGVKDFLIHAGQSSVLARGDQFAQTIDENDALSVTADGQPESATDGEIDDQPPRGWKVGIAHPTKPNRRLAGIWLRDAALATSGSGKQFFHHRGKRYGHVIDPRTGQPAGDLLSLSVVTRRAIDADALATGLFVMGRDNAKRFSETVARDESLDSSRRFTDPGNPLPLIMVAPVARQDEVEIQTTGDWDWADPPAGAEKDDRLLS
ncbi:thiamine biosynthesis lipoprotein [Rhodopirellula rubra]|uniref:FAD:protein FMN transferase n=1 Tax=Aporhodopirellula rubra TaxID=980271 RepID=A0A7W5H7K8_9BACT|nr:FAD:protein FMN transferase [Aporhodopirellula rubra]MBB3208524.1 thiamine biosynthesis lipoprotein [Aporhodopirellula rubra]